MTDLKDFKNSATDYAKAEIATLLPLEKMEAFKEKAGTLVDKARKRRAKRKDLRAKAVGQLVFDSSKDSDAPKPIAYMRVELWDRDLGGADDFLGRSATDEDGRFEIPYDPADAGLGDRADLALHVISEYDGKEKLFFVVKGDDDVTGDTFDFGTVGVPFYEYHPEIPLPHVLTFDYGKARFDAMPQAYPIGRKLALAQAASQVLSIRLQHYVSGGDDMPLEEIQDAYRGRTAYNPPAGPGPGASADERFIYKLLNGAYPALFSRDADGLWHVSRDWDAYEMDGEHYLPNVDAAFRFEDGVLSPVSITITERVDNAPEPGSPLAEPETFRPGDPGWAKAKHAFECNNYMFTQAANHLARGHFNVEQWALAFFRNLRLNPVRILLEPHLEQVMIINVEGENAIFGPDGLITKNGALTSNSLVQAIEDNFHIDWYGWSPRSPINDQHHVAHVAGRYWQVLTDYVDWFVDEHREEILAYFDELAAMSDDLVGHSIAFKPDEPPAGHSWVDTNETARADAPRVEVDGVLRQTSPFAVTGAPAAEQLDAVKQICRYVIFHATLWHSWINDTSDALEPSYSQYNPVERSTPKELTDHISLNLALSQTRYNMILADEDGDLPAKLKELLQEAAPEFRAFGGYDVRNIRSRINI